MFRSVDRDVFGLLAAPEAPQYGIVLAPGAGVTKVDERSRAQVYAEAGCACLVLDLRGNGGETAGAPFSLQPDYQRYVKGEWPEVYATVCDLSSARQLLASRYAIPVYAMGASNGGRWAALAAEADPGFAGYIGVSTSGFDLAGNEDTGSTRQFLLSIDPEHSIARIAPRPARPVYLFHSRGDPIIPYEQGQALFDRAEEPKTFISFNGTHVENAEVDREIMARICSLPPA
jgi:dienelactone hydrolase